MPVLSQMYIYPVKSLAGIQVTDWPVDKTGLRYDRKWMLVDEHGSFLSQRRLPRMALISPRIEDERLILSAPGQDDIAVPLNSHIGNDLDVEIWEDHCKAKTTDRKADDWFSRFLDVPCRLVYHPDERIRKVDPDYSEDSDQTAFSDGFPFLIISEASLQALNQAMNLDLPMIRFRPNLVVSGCESYAEDQWRQITINSIGFRLTKPCSRCSIPAIDPETALSGKEPLATLARLRKWQNKIYFGQNALHDDTGRLAVGNIVEINRTGESQPPL